jgi:hypothetical protein
MLKNYYILLLLLHSFIVGSQEKAHVIPHKDFIFCVNTIEEGIFFITSIHILDKKTADTIQSIEVQANMMFYYENAIKDAFILEDENFDGWTDIRVVKNEYANAEKDFYHWLYSPMMNKFVAHKELENLTQPTFDPKNKTVSSYFHSNNHSQETTYQFVDNKLTLVKQIDINDWVDYREKFTKELVNGEWETTRDIIGK